MIHFELPKHQSSIIKVIGVGGGGSNAVNYMYNMGVEGVDFIVCNTDQQALALSPVPNKIQLGPALTQGLGAGANPEIGKQASEESIEEIEKMLKVNTKMAFVTSGMGGGTGTGGAPVVARLCRELGILTVGIVSTPFTHEGPRRMKQAQEGIARLREHVDTILIISNDKLRHQFGSFKFTEAFAKADDVLATATKCITEVITSTGRANVDFADVSTVMRNGGVAILGHASAAGENRALQAVEQALSSPLLNDNDIRGAKWVLLNVTSAEGEHEHTLDDMDAINAYVQTMAGENCDVILGMGHDESLGDKIAVTVIATGFNHREVKPEAPKKDDNKVVMHLGSETAAPVPQTKADALAPTLVEGPAKPGYTPVQIPEEAPKERYSLELTEKSNDDLGMPQQPARPATQQPQFSTSTTFGTQTPQQNVQQPQGLQQPSTPKPGSPGANPAAQGSASSNMGNANEALNLGIVYKDDSPRDSASSSTLLRGYNKTREEQEEDRRLKSKSVRLKNALSGCAGFLSM
jgi:cell division protein FtsZ